MYFRWDFRQKVLDFSKWLIDFLSGSCHDKRMEICPALAVIPPDIGAFLSSEFGGAS
jgi:hypothetical protein